MQGFKIVALMLLSAMVLSGCKKEAPYIDTLTGTYKVSGSMYYDTTLIKYLNDTLMTISKVDDWTLQFNRSSCDTNFYSISLSYISDNGSSVQYALTGDGDHSPNSAGISFPKPPNGSFTYQDNFYCGGGFVGSSLAGSKVQ